MRMQKENCSNIMALIIIILTLHLIFQRLCRQLKLCFTMTLISYIIRLKFCTQKYISVSSILPIYSAIFTELMN